MISYVKNYLDLYEITNCKIIVGLSGGPDSVCLLSLLSELRQEYNIIVEAAYVNHGIRPDCDNIKDFELVKILCLFLGIKLHYKNIPHHKIEDESALLNSSVEAVARDYRYSFFNTLACNKDLIAIGHNRDDQAETQIMRFFQGSSIEGLLGIKERRENIIRPLINVDKSDIIKYLNLNGIDYRIDYTNNQLDYLRNSIRHKMVPVISDIFPTYKKALKKIENELVEYKSIVDNIYKPLVWDFSEQRNTVKYCDFINLPLIKRREEIYRLFDRSFQGITKGFRLPQRFLSPLSKEEFKNGEIILEGYDFKLVRNHNLLIWEQIDHTVTYFKIFIQSKGFYRNSRYTIDSNDHGVGVLIPNLEYPFSLRSYTLGYPEVKIIKKLKRKFQEYNNIIIVEKDNHVYAIIYKNKIIYIKSCGIIGIYINITEG